MSYILRHALEARIGSPTDIVCDFNLGADDGVVEVTASVESRLEACGVTIGFIQHGADYVMSADVADFVALVCAAKPTRVQRPQRPDWFESLRGEIGDLLKVTKALA